MYMYIYFHHVHLSIDSMFGCCVCSGILYFVLPSLTCYQCDLQYQVSVSRGKLCMPCSQASAAQSLACLRRCHGRIGWAGQPGGTKTCKLKWYAVSCYMICHDLLLLHTVPFMLKLRFTKHPVCWTQAKLPRDSPKRCSEPPLIKLSFNGAHLGLQGDTRWISGM